jgi:hypothetical protein
MTNDSTSKFEVERRIVTNVFTPKALHIKAQGREQSERTLGRWPTRIPNPEGVSQYESFDDSILCDPFRVRVSFSS